MVAKKNPELKRAVARLARISSDQATQILYDYQLKKTMDERVLQRTARAEGADGHRTVFLPSQAEPGFIREPGGNAGGFCGRERRGSDKGSG